MGNAAIAAYVLKNKDHQEFNDAIGIAFCWGVAVLIAISATTSVSGGHINPVITVTQAVYKNFPWKKVPHYLLGQYLGAFAASAVVYILYYEALYEYDGGRRTAFGHPYATGHIWATYPAPYLSIVGAFVDQVIGTAVLVFAVLAITDRHSGLNVPSHLQPVFLCFLITVMCTAFATNCMATLNPARDLAPRLFTTLAGWGWRSFEPLGGHFWWVAGLVGPHVGGLVGAGVFYLTIGLNKFSSSRDYAVTAVDSATKDEMEVIATGDRGKSKETRDTMTPL